MSLEEGSEIDDDFRQPKGTFLALIVMFVWFCVLVGQFGRIWMSRVDGFREE